MVLLVCNIMSGVISEYKLLGVVLFMYINMSGVISVYNLGVARIIQSIQEDVGILYTQWELWHTHTDAETVLTGTLSIFCDHWDHRLTYSSFLHRHTHHRYRD